MLIIHHLNKSRSHRILWLLEELAVPYDLKLYYRNKETMLAPPELKAIHPLGKSPVLENTETGDIVAESGAIVEYILDHFGNGRMIPPQGSPERLRYNFWMHYSESNIVMLNTMALVFTRMPEKAPFFIKPLLRAIQMKAEQVFYGPQLKLHFNFIEDELKKSTWFAGEELTGADIMMSFAVQMSLVRAASMGLELDGMKAFIRRMEAREAYKRVVERVGAIGI